MGVLAVPVRLAAAEERAARFAHWFNAPAAQKHRLEDNQAPFDFFTHASAAVESFCFAAYCFGAVVSRVAFPLWQKPGQIKPAVALKCYQAVALGDRFTEELAVLLNAPENQVAGPQRAVKPAGGRLSRGAAATGVSPLSPPYPVAVQPRLAGVRLG